MAARTRVARVIVWARFNEKKLKKVLVGTLALGVAAAIVWHQAQAKIFVVNTSDTPVMLIVDGVALGIVPIVSIETPDAASVFRVSPGTHRIQTHRASDDAPDDHEIVDDLDLRLSWAGSYLFAPGITDQCFWIQHTAYGRARRTLPALRALERTQRVWPIPDDIDGWFVPNPPSNRLDHRSTGGTRTAIRQGRCGIEPWQ
jgi:hypothetical protein